MKRILIMCLLVGACNQQTHKQPQPSITVKLPDLKHTRTAIGPCYHPADCDQMFLIDKPRLMVKLPNGDMTYGVVLQRDTDEPYGVYITCSKRNPAISFEDDKGKLETQILNVSNPAGFEQDSVTTYEAVCKA